MKKATISPCERRHYTAMWEIPSYCHAREATISPCERYNHIAMREKPLCWKPNAMYTTECILPCERNHYIARTCFHHCVSFDKVWFVCSHFIGVIQSWQRQWRWWRRQQGRQRLLILDGMWRFSLQLMTVECGRVCLMPIECGESAWCLWSVVGYLDAYGVWRVSLAQLLTSRYQTM